MTTLPATHHSGIFITLLAALALPAAGAGLTPVDPRCDGMANPLAAGSTPRLTWRVESQGRDKSQSAWQVRVASRLEILEKDEADLWDSGKQPAGRVPHVTYAGKPLVPGKQYHWKVRCWDEGDQESAWSEPAVMEVAPQSVADWRGAQWIDDGKPLPEKDEDFYETDPAPLLRREFRVEKPIARARLHVAGLGYAIASLNGERLAGQALDPPWTNFDKRILFRTHDVTANLTEGANCLGLALGNGWYNLEPLRMWGHRIFREKLPSGRPRAIALLVIDHPDGSQTTLTTSDGWRVTEGPSLRHSIFLGELRDARLALPGWDKPGFDDSSWRAPRVTDHPLHPLKPLLDMPPVRAAESFPAVAVTEPQPGVFIVDFGKNFTGVPEIKLDLPAGTGITMRYGELLYPDGTLNPMSGVAGQIKGTRKDADGNEVSVGGPGAPPIAWQQDVYITRGGGETYIPDFTFHGFRYMEITGLPAAPKVADFRAHFLRSDVSSAGSFASSDGLLNRIQEITRRTFLANIVSVQSDCPHRERLGYGGDIVATDSAYLMNFDMAGFYTKTVRDWSDAALPDGTFTDTAPFVGIQYCGVGWAMAHPVLLEKLYQHYGERDLILEQLPAAIRWFDGEAARRKGGLVTTGLGDHEALTPSRGPVFSTPMFIATAQRMARLARLIGMEEDATRFDQYAAESTAAWQKEFLDGQTGKVGEGTQTSQLFALGFNAMPDDAAEKVFAQLVDNLNSAQDAPRLTTGIYGTMLLLEELSKRGRHDLAVALASRKTFPSWGWMLENDATTLWEAWEGTDGGKSHSHPMFGSISAWFYRWLGGIQPAADAIGFDRIVIRPQVGHGLDWVKSSHDSIRGRIESNWKITDKGTEFEIVIPPDTTAAIELPAGTLAEADGVAVAEPSANRMKVGSGRYRFLVVP
jgi:alpha-L-rhamnosidase